jgi:5-methylcytosine-specific restriction endonuclease McrA
MNVRETLPQRRLVTTNNPTGTNWSEHKPDLKEDFHSHCGYCGSYDGFRHTYFEVDHFIPKSFFEKNRNIEYCHYPNLVYSCKFCNNKKLSKWPSQREDVFHINDEGFIDPCDLDYENHLYRTNSGGILWKTKLGEWMVKKAFKFDERDSAIKLLWELNQRRILIDRFVDELLKLDINSQEYRNIEQEAEKLSFEYVKLDKELMEYYNRI